MFGFIHVYSYPYHLELICEIRKHKMRKMKSENSVVIIGGGASGMMAGISAARMGARVEILEHESVMGKKLLATGNGKCNFTNSKMELSCFRGGDLQVVEKVLQCYGHDWLVETMEEMGILPYQREGYFYPNSQQAASVRDVLVRELNRLGVLCHTKEHVTEVKYLKEQGFRIKTVHGLYHAKKLILATGGACQPKLGSDGSGYEFAKQLGHHITGLGPALTGIICRDEAGKKRLFPKLKGIRVKGRLSLYKGQELVASDEGELQLTDYGISGIPAFQLSRYVSLASEQERQKMTLVMDVLPRLEMEELYIYLKKQQERNPDAKGITWLFGLVNDKLLTEWFPRSGIDLEGCARMVRDDLLRQLARELKGATFAVENTKDFSVAQVTAGGVRLSEVDEASMESRLCPGLYLTGELLDVDGICGGYNLQWAFSTGYLAGGKAGEGGGKCQKK